MCWKTDQDSFLNAPVVFHQEAFESPGDSSGFDPGLFL